MIRSSETQHIRNLADQIVIKSLESKRIKTGFTEFDDSTGGLDVGLYVFASRPANGKSSFILSMALQMSRKENLSVMICSLEMSAAQLTLRLLQIDANIENARKLICKTKPEDKVFLSDIERLKECDILINDENNINIKSLLLNVEEILVDQHLDVIFIDYIQLISNAKGRLIPDYVFEKLNQFSQKYGVTVIVSSELPREGENSINRIPLLRHLDSFGNFSKYARGIGFLYRPEYYGYLSDETGESNAKIGMLHYYAEGDTKLEIKLKFEAKFGKYENLLEC